MEKEKQILNLYYVEHKNQKQIAQTIQTSQQYISKVIKKDTRYNNEKEYRKSKNAQNRKLKKAKYQIEYRKSKKEDVEYQSMLLKQKQHSIDISGKTKFFNDS